MGSGETLKLNPDELTVGDLEDFEEVAGQSFQEAFQMKRVVGPDGKGQDVAEFSAKALKAIIWIVKRKDNPDFSLDDARNFRIGALEFEDEDDAPPTAAAAFQG